ncbi:MAG TPA: YgjP-like metallopeptidase domain-containing protein [Nitrososphaerales archaeon]|nr:YgjP-like metallopeptidase domain-containing protein [Nitrososphaerales archaeon]
MVRGGSRRYTYFRFKPDLTLEVVIPKGRKVDVDAALRDKLPWIAKEYDRMTSARMVLHGDQVMFGGSYLRIVHTPDTKEELVPDLKANEVHIRTSDRRRIKELVRRWFLKETSAYVVRKVADFTPLVGAKPSRVDVREISKWGYCTRGGRLSFSWQLIALPDRLREYVVLHELAHLVEFNHSPAFRRKLSAVCPDFRRRERELDSILPYDRMAVL